MKRIEVVFKNGVKKYMEVENFSTGEFSSIYERDQEVKLIDFTGILREKLYRIDFCSKQSIYFTDCSLDEVDIATTERIEMRDCNLSHCTLSAEEILLSNCQMTAVTIKGKVQLEGENSFSEGKERHWNRGDSVPCKINI